MVSTNGHGRAPGSRLQALEPRSPIHGQPRGALVLDRSAHSIIELDVRHHLAADYGTGIGAGSNAGGHFAGPLADLESVFDGLAAPHDGEALHHEPRAAVESDHAPDLEEPVGLDQSVLGSRRPIVLANID